MTIITYYLTQNRYSRSGKKMNELKGIVLHHCMNEGYSAIAERNYMDNLKLGKNAVYYGTHYIIGFEGEIINCIPEDEIAYHRGSSENGDGYISIEYCAASNNQPLSYNSMYSLKKLVIDIAKRHSFKPEECFFRHSDIAERKCPLYYAQNDGQWKKLKKDIADEREATNALKKNSTQTADTLSGIINADKRYLKLILEQKAAPDAKVMLNVADKLLGR